MNVNKLLDSLKNKKSSLLIEYNKIKKQLEDINLKIEEVEYKIQSLCLHDFKKFSSKYDTGYWYCNKCNFIKD